MARSPELARLFQQPDLPGPTPLRDLPRLLPRSAHPPTNSPSGSSSMSAPSEPSSATSPATPTSTPSSPPPRPGRKTSPKRDAISRAGLRTPPPRGHPGRHPRRAPTRGVRRQRIVSLPRPAPRRLGRDPPTSVRSPQPGELANDGSIVPDVADVRALSLEDGRRFPTKVAGLFLFLPLLLDLDLPRAVTQAGLPGSEQIPPLQALLALAGPQTPRQAARQSHQRPVL